MNEFVIFALIGATNGLYLLWLFICRDVLEEDRDNRKLGFPNQVDLGDAMQALFLFMIFAIAWPLFIFVSIVITWNEFSFADIVVWKRKAPKIKKELDEATVKAAAKKLGFNLQKKEPDPIVLKGVDRVAN